MNSFNILTIQTRLNITSQRISQRLGSNALLDRNNMLQIFSFCSCKVCSLYCNVLARDLGRWLLERWVGKQGRVKVGLGPARRAGGHTGLRIDWFSPSLLGLSLQHNMPPPPTPLTAIPMFPLVAIYVLIRWILMISGELPLVRITHHHGTLSGYYRAN